MIAIVRGQSCPHHQLLWVAIVRGQSCPYHPIGVVAGSVEGHVAWKYFNPSNHIHDRFVNAYCNSILNWTRKHFLELLRTDKNASSGDATVNVFQVIKDHQENADRLPPIEEVNTILSYGIRGVLSTYSQVVRESSDIDRTTVDHIEIPPPRPKRKPANPYPRNVHIPLMKGHHTTGPTSPCSLESNHENLSPDSPDQYASIQSLKLFGKTVFVMDYARPSSPDTITTLPLNLTLTQAQECSTTPCLSSDNICGSKGDKSYAKGFLPYKRCLAETRTTHSFMLTIEESEDLRVRLCL
ncbi:myb domain, Homeodomain-like protein [Artemisia annua]|uniref:Myb domain, Homeodomain-like protein n=1 Tax=Artemisia annua TaxID=35608 RepID=A0A2U1LLH2_ARTAN|nr:myb domain, Homeodomain-like protein [Artemisia annua]